MSAIRLSVTLSLCAAAALVATASSAQQLDLSGRYRCIQICAPELAGQFAYIAQNGSDLNLTNDAGEPSRGWIDYPGHIWVDRANQGAIYSATGLTIQFDRGTVWQRVPDLPPVLAPRTR
ncbi:MAG: hypothetical protein ACJ8F3_10550 [Xanthobacteraceae bacterium]